MFAVGTKLPLEEFEDVKAQMETFSLRFNSLILEKKSEVLNSKQHHINKLNELERRIHKLKADISASKLRKDRTEKMIADSISDLRSKQTKVDEMKEQLDSLTQSKETVEKEIASLKSEVALLEELLRYSQKNLGEQLARDIGELTKYEMYMGLRIEAVDVDLLKFKFINIDANDVDKEVWCELYIGEDRYKVTGTGPTLPVDKVAHIERELNEHGEFIIFLRAMRSSLRDAAEK